MPLESKVIIDFGKFQTNIAAGLTMRQLLLSVAGVALVIWCYMRLSQFAGMQLSSYTALCAGLPCFLFAFAKPRRLRLERFLLFYLRFLFSSRTRVWEAENTMYRYIFKKEQQLKKKNRKGANHAKTKNDCGKQTDI